MNPKPAGTEGPCIYTPTLPSSPHSMRRATTESYTPYSHTGLMQVLKDIPWQIPEETISHRGEQRKRDKDRHQV